MFDQMMGAEAPPPMSPAEAPMGAAFPMTDPNNVVQMLLAQAQAGQAQEQAQLGAMHQGALEPAAAMMMQLLAANDQDPMLGFSEA